MPSILADPSFYAVAIPAVILIGLSKGGFGGAMALMGTPLMSLVMPPIQAAAILLPILIMMDLVSLWTWRGQYNGQTLKILLPGAIAGIAFGWAMASVVTDGAVRLIVGLVAVLFVIRWLWRTLRKDDQPAQHNLLRGSFWGAIAGFTSFVAHAGGPPFQIYAMPLKYNPRTYTGTSVIFFAVVNAVKLVPYFALGELGEHNLSLSAVLLPLAALSTLFGAWLVRRMRTEVFYPFMYAMILIVGGKLVYDGLAGMI
jgi:uncharacterized membrane protein YfcA